MTLFCAAIRRELVSLLRFLLHSHVHVFSSAISTVLSLEISIRLFFFPFLFFNFIVFLSVLTLLIQLLIAKINLSLLFLKIVLKSLYSYLPTPPLEQDMTQGQFLSGV